MNPEEGDGPDPFCMGCGLMIEEGSVVAFGDGIWHVECFRCAKCATQVETNSNLLLLSDGSPVCENCSYSCHMCNLPIRDEAIMTGDEAYHAECFRCVQCKKKIDDLVFTQTSRGIFCTSCHEQRKAEKQRRKEEKMLQQQRNQPSSYNDKSLPSLPKDSSSLRDDMPHRPLRPVLMPLAGPGGMLGASSDSEKVSRRHHSRIFDPQAVSDFMAASGGTGGSPGPSGKPKSPVDNFRDRDGSDWKNHSPGSSPPSPSKLRGDLLDSPDSPTDGVSTPLSSPYQKSSPEEKTPKRSLDNVTPSRNDVLEIMTSGPQNNGKLERKIMDTPTLMSFDHQQQSYPLSSSLGLPVDPRQKISNDSPSFSTYNSSNTSLLNSYTSLHTDSTSNTPDASSIDLTRHTLASPTFEPSMPSLTFSFAFEKDSEELANLTKLLGSTISLEGEDEEYDKDEATEYEFVSASSVEGGPAHNQNRATFGNGTVPFSDEPIPPTPTTNSYKGSRLTVDSVSDSHTITKKYPPKERSSVLSLMPEDVERESFDSAYVNKLKSEYKTLRAKLTRVEENFNKIKTVSTRALEEFNRAKEEFAKEVALRQQAEITNQQLKAQLIAYQVGGNEEAYMKVTREEVARLAFSRNQLEQACVDLKFHKDALVREVEEVANQSQSGLVAAGSLHHLERLKQSYMVDLNTLIRDRDAISEETVKIEKIRDECIHETVVLNTKNAELTTMNNDLSRRVTEREREAAAVIAATSFLNPSKHKPNGSLDFNATLSSVSIESPQISSSSPQYPPRKSSDSHNHNNAVRKVVQRDSFNGTQAPTLFKFKKGKGANLFGAKKPPIRTASSRQDISSPTPSEPVHKYNNPYPSMPPQMSTSNFSGSLTKKDLRGLKNVAAEIPGTALAHGTHSFHQVRFLRPVKCDICGDKIWGSSELRCGSCGLQTHAKCGPQAPQYCLGLTSSMNSDLDADGYNKVTMFGNDLSAQVEYESRTVPLVVVKCIEAVEARGMDYEGIYRKPGGATQMRSIQLIFEQGEEPDLDDTDEYNDISAVTSVLKQYFRELPNPLLTYELYGGFLEAIVLPNGEEKLRRFENLMVKLPKPNYDTLRALMLHLDRVHTQSAHNLMTAKNLSVVFGPTLMRDRDPSRDLLDMMHKNSTVEFIINNVPILFPVTSSHSSLPSSREGYI